MRPFFRTVTLTVLPFCFFLAPVAKAAPSITSLSPTSGAVGASVTITGTNFGSTQGTSTVKFNGTTATPSSWGATSIVAAVPTGATTGNVVVTVSGTASNGKSFTVVAAPSITSLSPTSGGVGAAITVTGTNFGSTQGASTVKFNGTSATPTSWSATSIAVAVPVGASTGNVVVHASGVDSNGKSFTVLPTPSITSLSPTSGAVGAAITITGTNFGATQGTSTVKFNGTTATPTSWSATSIVAPVPTGATTGNVVVTVSGVASAGTSFTVVVAPSITTLSPTSGAAGVSVTITGTNFGSTQGSSTVKFNGTAATPTSWSATSIVVPVPSAATTGNVVVHASGVDSNGKAFTVVPTPSITNLAPTTGAVGASVTITGTNFGATQGTSTVKFNGITATPSSWSATSIVATVPSGATTGNVIVTVSSVPSNGVTFTVVSGPSITTLSPTTGAVGVSVTITGTNFGTTQGTSTVKFNGVTATPTSWSATSIAVPVPSGATTGNVVVTVGGVASAGKPFTVAPGITSLSPSTGAIGTVVTINGTTFGSPQGSSTVTFNGVTATPTSWSATAIVVPVPSGATTGNVVVTVAGVASAGKPFTVGPGIATLSPTSGVVGDSVTITGTNFGATQGTSTVKFNGTTSTPTSWSATSIVTPVPTGATTGNVVVTVSNVASPGVTFTVIATPVISSISPTSGAIGTSVTITGTNFQPTQGTSTVTFNGTAAAPTSWTATQIKAPAPSGATTGNIVVTAFGFASNGKTFTVKPTPSITSLSQTEGAVGMTVTIFGANFGTTQGSSTVKFNGVTATPTSWTATQVSVPVPIGATSGSVVIHTSGVDTNGINFVVATVTSIVLTPPNLSLPLNSVQRYVAMGTYSDGSTQSLASNATWSSSNTAVATLAMDGLLTAVGQGSTTIQASFGSVSASVTVAIKGPSFVPVGTSLNTARFSHTATRLPNGKVLITGGENCATSCTILASAELYDPTTGTFSLTGSLLTARSNHTATLLNNGLVLIAGGSNFLPQGGVNTLASAELYNPTTGTFTSTGSMNHPQTFHTATLLSNGGVLIANGGGGSTPPELYDPTSGTFAVTGSTITSHSLTTATLLTDGTVLVAGGGPDQSGRTFAGAEIYSPATGTFQATGSLNVGTQSHTATLLTSGKVLIAGGTYDCSTCSVPSSARAELYDPAAQTFAVTENLAVARTGHTATFLNDGSVLIVSGQTLTAYTGTAEVFDPVSQHFTGAGSLATPRSGHTATLLSDGTVLIVGGSDQHGNELVSAELYEPVPLAPSSLQVTPATVTMQVGETRQFTAVDNHGNPRADVTWSVSDTSLATITPDSPPTLTAVAPGQVIVTANAEGVTAQGQVTIVDQGTTVPGTALWSVPSVPGFIPLQIAQAVPTDNGPDLYSIQLSGDDTQSIVQALTADGQQKWQSKLPVVTGTSVPDGNGGLLVTVHHTCLPGQTDPMAIMDVDGATGEPLWQIAAAGVQNGNSIVYCYPDTVKELEPQIAVRGDGAVAIAAMTNNGLPPLTVVTPTGFGANITIPTSTSTRPDGTQFADFSPMGPPTVDVDGSIYVEYEVRQVAYPPRVTSAILYLLKIDPPTPPNVVGFQHLMTLSSTTEDTNLLPGRVIPDGQGGVLATWTISPSNPPQPPPPNPHTYQASHVVGGVPGTPYDLPFNPHTAPLGKYPTMVLGENGTVLASGLSAANDGSSSDVDQIASFALNSGTANWSYQASTQGALSIVEATSDGGLTINDTDPGVIHFDTNGNASATIPFLQGAKPFDLGGWISGSNGGVNLLWSPTGTNGIPTTLASSVFPASKGNVQGQNQPPFCQRTNSNCALAPHLDLTSPNPLSPGVNLRQVVYELYSLQSGVLTPMVGSSQTQQTRIAGLETNPTNPAGVICDWKTVNTKCESPNDSDTAGIYTDKYSVGSTGVNTVKQQFFVDRGQVRIFWPQGNPKTWYGAWDQQATTDATKGAIIQQNSPDLQNGATCTLSPPDPHGCSPVQADGTQ